MFKHITVEDNYVVGSGYGWSHQTADYDWGIPGPVNNGNCSMFFAFPTEASEDIQVKNNVFYLAKYALVGGKVGDQTKSKRYNVTFAGNTYVQNQGGALAEWAVPNDDDYMKNFPYNQDARKTVAEVLGDQTAVFFGMN